MNSAMLDDALAHAPHVAVLIVGAGQAGLAMSWFLTRDGVEHVLLERHDVGHAWQHERWDSFHLVTPNWHCRLPGFAYAGDDPDGFMPKHGVVAYLRAFRDSFDPPVRAGVSVTSLAPSPAGGYDVQTNAGRWHADQVVIATGGYHDPAVPEAAATLPATIRQLTSASYTSPDDLAPGAVMVVGTGQSGAQIAEDLHLADRRVHLCVGPAPRIARRYRGRDVVEWLERMGINDLPVERHPLGEAVRATTSHYVSGRDGGRDIDLRRFAVEGMRLHGSLAGIACGQASFNDDLAINLDAADAAAEAVKHSIDVWIGTQGLAVPDEPSTPPVWRPQAGMPALALQAAGITSIIWCIGFRPNYAWVKLDVFDSFGRPVHHRGVTAQPGVYFLGLPWLHSWGSGRLSGVGRDAEYLAGKIKEGGLGLCLRPAGLQTSSG